MPIIGINMLSFDLRYTRGSFDLAARGADPTRIAAQIVTGIGFFGAGAIMRTGSGVHGMTTAATIWVNAAVSMAVGGGEYRLALIAIAVTILALIALHPLEVALDRRIANRRTPDNGSDFSTDA